MGQAPKMLSHTMSIIHLSKGVKVHTFIPPADEQIHVQKKTLVVFSQVKVIEYPSEGDFYQPSLTKAN